MATSTTTKLQICNRALGIIGIARITSAELITPVSAASKRIEDCYPYILDELLAEHPWSFAQKRVTLALDITAATAANPIQITSTAHGLSDEDKIKITSVDGMTELNGNTYYVANSAANTFTLQSAVGTDVDGSDYTAYTEDGYITKYAALEMDDDDATYTYTLPSDFIRENLLSVAKNNLYYTIEAGYIYSDTDSLKMIYTYRNEDPLLYPPKFVTALATRIAGEICFNLTQSAKRATDLAARYEHVDLIKAMAADSSQGSPEELDQTEWELSRI